MEVGLCVVKSLLVDGVRDLVCGPMCRLSLLVEGVGELVLYTQRASVATDTVRTYFVSEFDVVSRRRIYFLDNLMERQSCTECTGHGNEFELNPTVKMETRHPTEDSLRNEFLLIYNHCGVMAA